SEPRALHAGIAVGTLSTYIALFDLKGRTVRSVDIDVEVADESQDDFIQRIMATLNRLTTGVSRPLATVGVTTSGSVTGDGEVYAPNLGWRDAEIGAQLREQFSVPVVVTSAAAAIVGSEIQSSPSLN
ncbi:ROK family protein, partial [Pedobacter sp. N36a]